MKTSYKVCSSSFKWIGNKGTANGSELIMVHDDGSKFWYLNGSKRHDGVFVKSIKTGAEKYFEPVHDEDGYDGEFMIYRCDQLFIQIWNY